MAAITENPEGYWWAWLFHPAFLSVYLTVIFVPLRLIIGGANYMPGRCWYHFCNIVYLLVAAGLALSVWKVPVAADWQTFLHVGFAAAHLQVDLAIGRWMIGRKFGPWTLPAIFLHKLDPRPWINPDGFSPGVSPLVRSMFEFNAAFTHEIFWNVCYADNCFFYGIPEALALCTVPLASCIFHGIASNFWTGVRCLPNFVQVALAFHASGSILPPMFLHAMWYFLEGKPLMIHKWIKHDWDAAERAAETGTPPLEFTFWFGLSLVLVFYLPLNVLVHYVPELKSKSGYDHAADYTLGNLPTHSVEQVSLLLCLLQSFTLMATWKAARAGMDLLAETGEFTTEAFEVYRSKTEPVAASVGVPPVFIYGPRGAAARVHPEVKKDVQHATAINAAADEET